MTEEEEEEERRREEKVLKLFGVMIHGGCNEEGMEEEMMRKCWSLSNLATCNPAATPSAAAAGSRDQNYLSDGGLDESSRKGRGRRGQERKRGAPWTEEEHRTFLAGLEKLGRGDWRGISREFVKTRTPTQVASHAQKYFLRKNNPAGKMRRRSSLFDLVPITPHHHQADAGHHTESGGVDRHVRGGSRLAKDESIPTSSLMPVSQKADSADQLRGPTLPLADCPALSAEANDLELRIALPQPHKLGKLSSQRAAGKRAVSIHGSSSGYFIIFDASLPETMRTGTCGAPR